MAAKVSAHEYPVGNDEARLVPQTTFDGPNLTFDFPGLHVGVAEYAEGPTGAQ